jgi:hypothetical protein
MDDAVRGIGGHRQRVKARSGRVSRMTYSDIDEREHVPSGAVGGVAFAATLMFIIGVFSMVAGLAGLIDESYVTPSPRYAFDLDPTVWGWLHLILGAAVAACGIGLFANKRWAGTVAIVFAGLIAIDYFFYIPYQPFWSLVVIGLSVWVIWAVIQARAGAAEASEFAD